MSYFGEAASGSIPYMTTNTTPGVIPVGSNGQVLTMVAGTPAWSAAAGGSGTFAISQTEIDFGTTPVGEGYFEIVNASITALHKVMANVSYDTPTDKDRDEIEMDDIILRCAASGGGFIMFARAADGSYLHDKFKIDYTYA